MKISIVTVCFNSEATIERAIQSVIAQKYEELEYIVIDGNSSDRTCEIIRKYEEDISYWISEPDEGIYHAMNKGIAAATGQVIAFLNSDDWYNDNTLSKVRHYFENNDVDLVSGNIYFYEEGEALVEDIPKQTAVEDYFFDIGLPHPALFARTALFPKYGSFDTQYKIAADYDWMLRVCTGGARVLVVEDFFTYFSCGGMSTAGKYQAVKEQRRAALAHMERTGRWDLQERLEAHYKERLHLARRNIYYIQNMDHVGSRLKALYPQDGTFYIWGAGKRGRQCLELLDRADIPITGFVDSYTDSTTFMGHEIIRPERIAAKSYVFVTPQGHTESIRQYVQEHGFAESQIIDFSDLIDRLAASEETEDD